MHVYVEVPPLPADADEDVVLAQWLVTVSQRVEPEQPLAVLELAKTSTEVPSPTAGVVQELLCAADEEVAPGQRICVVDATPSTDATTDATTDGTP